MPAQAGGQRGGGTAAVGAGAGSWPGASVRLPPPVPAKPPPGACPSPYHWRCSLPSHLEVVGVQPHHVGPHILPEDTKRSSRSMRMRCATPAAPEAPGPPAQRAPARPAGAPAGPSAAHHCCAQQRCARPEQARGAVREMQAAGPACLQGAVRRLHSGTVLVSQAVLQPHLNSKAQLHLHRNAAAGAGVEQDQGLSRLGPLRPSILALHGGAELERQASARWRAKRGGGGAACASDGRQRPPAPPGPPPAWERLAIFRRPSLPAAGAASSSASAGPPGCFIARRPRTCTCW